MLTILKTSKMSSYSTKINRFHSLAIKFFLLKEKKKKKAVLRIVFLPFASLIVHKVGKDRQSICPMMAGTGGEQSHTEKTGQKGMRETTETGQRARARKSVATQQC